ncbi:transglutaminase-like domain-containing protein [Shewanella polaris]|uniref:Transglutaminase domain-containing protein n=1 Tax=Shewanella polaris TaxID=2588449 RepID=A0A4Y5YH18_9GAMM|nr:transglutaminase-like domain-containing protein [Shewanella polaris]QDE31895.1 transglutaminase domain-containing protein [Shewanella polaris]
MKDYLCDTDFIDYSDIKIQQISAAVCSPTGSNTENAIALYLYVRDSIKYDPYALTFNKSCFTASEILKAGKGYCVSKAILLTALLRSVNIPARLGFSDVVNHLSSKKLLERMRTNIFYYHGYVEIFLNDQWVIATPAFDSNLCKTLGIPPLEFDGKHDSKFQKYDDAGNQYMEYRHNHGHFSDVPYDLLVEKYSCYYPALMNSGHAPYSGDLHVEIKSDMKQ